MGQVVDKVILQRRDGTEQVLPISTVTGDPPLSMVVLYKRQQGLLVQDLWATCFYTHTGINGIPHYRTKDV